MKTIPLSKGMVAVVDDEDYAALSKYKWHCNGVYAARNAYMEKHLRKRKYQQRRVWMHREIMQTPPHLECDHINRNPLDNRRVNLRNCTPSENGVNRNRRRGSTGVIGVAKRNYDQFQAYISHNKIKVYLGNFYTLEEAVQARRMAEIKYHGRFSPEIEKDSIHQPAQPYSNQPVCEGADVLL
jgi:hypothetical protein